MALSRGLPGPPRNVTRDGARQHYEQPRHYDRVYGARAADVAFYTELAVRRGGPVLEYGIGSGRVALAIAARGIDVFGVDHSAAMLRRLGEKLADAPELAGRVRWARGDMRKKKLPRRFGLIIAPFNTVLHLYTTRDVRDFLSRVREHLLPEGRFVFDFSVPRPADLAADPERWYGGGKLKHPELGATVRYKERFHYSPMTQVLSTWMRFEGKNPEASAEVLLTQRQFFPQEMDALLRCNGFSNCRWSADFAVRPASAAADVLVVDCTSAAC